MNQSILERWVPAKGFPRYNVSNLGNIIDLRTGYSPKIRIQKGRYYVTLYRSGGSCVFSISRLIALSFFEMDPTGFEVDHVDGDRRNNALWNLEIVTGEENRERAHNMGLIRRPHKLVNNDTGEVYSSAIVAGRKLGLISAVMVPKEIRETGGVFKYGGISLTLVK
jgi:hypothetical protein